MHDEPSTAHGVSLEALATLPGEPEVTLDELLEIVLELAADGEKHLSERRLSMAQDSFENARNLLRDFQRLARGGAPRVATLRKGAR